MNQSVLLVTFQYPPIQASSGLLRALAFSRDLTELGWAVSVLTASVFGDKAQNGDNLSLVPDKVRVVRAGAVDAAKSLSIKGRYPGIFEWPDRYSTWVPSATIAGYLEMKKRKSDVIFSTYPIASAHLVGYFLALLSGKPWVADFRDPMIMDEHPDTQLRRRAHEWVEKRTIQRCTLALLTNDHAKQHYQAKYPEIDPKKFYVVENGYDEELFAVAEESLSKEDDKPQTNPHFFKILHSGTLYPNHRDPTALFAAIKALSPGWEEQGKKVKFVFRASGYDEHYNELVQRYGVGDVVTFAEPVGYVESLKEMLTSDALLLIQGSSCNEQIPAKLYEYFRARKPVFSLTDPNGATAARLRDAGAFPIAHDESKDALKNELSRFVNNLGLNNKQTVTVSPSKLASFSRVNRSERLSGLLRGAVASN